MGVLSERVAIVTGAAQGIGEAIVHEFAAEGAHVVVADINSEGALRVAKNIESTGGKALSLALDVTREESVDAMMKAAAQHCHSVDILVNNAGIYPRFTWHEMSVDQWDNI